MVKHAGIKRYAMSEGAVFDVEDTPDGPVLVMRVVTVTYANGRAESAETATRRFELVEIKEAGHDG